MGRLKDAREAALAAKTAQQEAAHALAQPHAATETQYRVDTLREKLIGDHIADDKLAELLNHRASEGWHLKQIVEASVAGRVGPGGTSGLLIVFERRTA